MMLMHEGDVSVASPGKGHGSTFTLRFPLLEHFVEEPPPVASPRVNADQLRVMVVDDNTDSALMLAMLLRSLNCETRVAHSCEEALRVGGMFLPELIFCDIGMPVVDGYETCGRMRKTDWGAHAGIMALTGWGQEEDRKKSHEAGFDEHLVKPIDRKSLMNVLLAQKT
jgi:CheY-like chemotaxis protein